MVFCLCQLLVKTHAMPESLSVQKKSAFKPWMLYTAVGVVGATSIALPVLYFAMQYSEAKALSQDVGVKPQSTDKLKSQVIGEKGSDTNEPVLASVIKGKTNEKGVDERGANKKKSISSPKLPRESLSSITQRTTKKGFFDKTKYFKREIKTDINGYTTKKEKTNMSAKERVKFDQDMKRFSQDMNKFSQDMQITFGPGFPFNQ